ncbi:MAG: caspase family protein [Pseudomonadota bacterium]|nr:caspase family protein [Pseudomonadota bacterium]
MMACSKNAAPRRLSALLLCLLVCGSAAARNVALLVAVGQFRDPSLKSFELKGPAIDIDSVQQTLTGQWGFAPADVLALRDQEATHDRILKEIAGLEQRSSKGDTVLIYFSGHGTSANADGNSFDLPYATGAWVPYDLDYSSLPAAKRTLVVGRRDLVPRLKRLDEGGRWVVVVSDSCYSGQVVRSFGQKFSHTRFLPMNPRDLGVAHVTAPISARPQPPPYPYQHVVLLSGASDSETGADISTPQALQQAPTFDGKYHGAFSDAFLRLLKGQLLPGAFNYAQAREAMNSFLEHRNFPQHPQLLPAIAEDPQDVGSNAFLGMNSIAPPSLETDTIAPSPSRNVLQVRLENVSAPLRAKIAAIAGVSIVQSGGDLTLRQTGEEVQLMGPAGDPVVTTAASDPNVIKRIAAQAWLNRTLPGGTDKLGLRADTDPGSRGNTYVHCESFVFEVRLQKPAFVMLMDLDSQGDLTVLYPAGPLERRLVPSGVATAIPGADPKDHIVVTPPFGTDLVTVMAFEKQPAFFVDLTGAQRFATDANRADALAKGLASAAGAISVRQITVNTYPGKMNESCTP